MRGGQRCSARLANVSIEQTRNHRTFRKLDGERSHLKILIGKVDSRRRRSTRGSACGDGGVGGGQSVRLSVVRTPRCLSKYDFRLN